MSDIDLTEHLRTELTIVEKVKENPLIQQNKFLQEQVKNLKREKEAQSVENQELREQLQYCQTRRLELLDKFRGLLDGKMKSANRKKKLHRRKSRR